MGEVSIADMDATRVRKDREFSRLQRNLMELLQEQKYELDTLREKGIELETATANSACFFLSVPMATSSAPSFMCFMLGTFAAVAAAAAAAAASAEDATAAVVVSAFISRSCCSMFREEKYDRDMDMNWNFM